MKSRTANAVFAIAIVVAFAAIVLIITDRFDVFGHGSPISFLLSLVVLGIGLVAVWRWFRRSR